MRKRAIEFYEVQRMRQWWIWLVMIAVNVIFIWGCIQQLLLQKPWGTNPMNNVELIIVTASMILLNMMMFSTKLHTYINNEGVFVRFFLFHFRYKFFDWNNIETLQVKKYNSYRAGGWGLKVTLDGTRYYTVSGNMCLSLILENGRKIIISTKRPIEMEVVLRKLGKMEAIGNG
ncbi:MAG: DUF6141 family protein [Petrimonas sp.]|jgi:hypothetical protein